MEINGRARMTRTDTHAPRTFDPAEYTEVGYFDNHPEEGGTWVDPDFACKDTFTGNYETRGRCDHCGAGPLRYGVVFHHAPTDTTLVVGSVCAGKLNLGSKSDIERKANLAEAIRRVKLETYLDSLTTEQREAIDWAHDVCITPYVAEDGSQPFRAKFPGLQGETVAFISDLSHKLHRYGSLSEKQLGALIKVKTRIEGFALRNADEAAALAEVPALEAGRQTLTGEVVSIKSGENDYGYWVKMLVKLENGNKVYGTIPSSINPNRGDTVQFDARVECSKDDEHFGFFSRPTKASVVNSQEVTA